MFTLMHNDQIVAQYQTYNECLGKLHRVQGASWDHAMKHEGWKIVETNAPGVVR